MTMRKSFWSRLARLCVIVFAIALCAGTRLNAQGYGTISGTVTDPSGAVVTGANVVATQVQSGKQIDHPCQ